MMVRKLGCFYKYHKTVCLLSYVMQFLLKQDVVPGQITVTGISVHKRNERFHLTDRQKGGIY